MNGIFVVVELEGEVREAVRAIQREFDPKLANMSAPHVTLVGSSGVGPIPLGVPAARLRELIEPITRATAPFAVRLEPAHRFMTTDIVVLPIDPHGPIRALHEAIAATGFPFARSRFPFSPHVTLNFYKTLTPETARRLLAIRLDAPLLIDRIQFYHTIDPGMSKKILELRLEGDDR